MEELLTALTTLILAGAGYLGAQKVGWIENKEAKNRNIRNIVLEAYKYGDLAGSENSSGIMIKTWDYLQKLEGKVEKIDAKIEKSNEKQIEKLEKLDINQKETNLHLKDLNHGQSKNRDRLCVVEMAIEKLKNQ